MPDKILPIIRTYVGHPDLARLVDEPSTTLADLRLDEAALGGIAMDIEDELRIVITQEEMEAWDTVSDVLACAAGKVVPA